MTRRQLLRVGLMGAGALVTGACGARAPDSAGAAGAGAADGRLVARPGPGDGTTRTGLAPLELQAERDALVFVPASYRPGGARPLVVLLHGAGGDARGGLAPLLPLAEQAGLVLVAPASAGSTWDEIAGASRRDAAMVDQALAATFSRYTIDPARVAVAGFSDGASYALSLGLRNGDLFRRAVAFAPGFARLDPPVGRPEIFVTHGRQDPVLPIDRCSRRIVPRLRRRGYAVDYREFEGGHVVPPPLAAAAVDWLAR